MTEARDVLIVGGGPVGIASSLLLARHGFRVRVLERSTEIYDLPRAIVMDDEIQRVLQNAGLAEELRAITTPMAGAEFVGPDRARIIGIDLPLDAQWPLGHHPVVCCYQPELEAMLRRAAIAAGVEVLLGVDVLEVSQSATSVSVVARRGSETLTYSGVVAGCRRRCRQSDPKVARHRLRRPGIRPGLARTRRPTAPRCPVTSYVHTAALRSASSSHVRPRTRGLSAMGVPTAARRIARRNDPARTRVGALETVVDAG